VATVLMILFSLLFAQSVLKRLKVNLDRTNRQDERSADWFLD